MTIDVNKWKALAEKYPSKAKWADALLLLNPEDHDDLLSALIELDPQDLARFDEVSTSNIQLQDRLDSLEERLAELEDGPSVEYEIHVDFEGLSADGVEIARFVRQELGLSD